MPARQKHSLRPVALVTGGAHGIGRGIAQRFLTEGFAVVIADWTRAEGQTAVRELQPAGDISFVPTDVSREADVRRAIRATIRRHKRLDVLINNAGITDPVTGFDLKRWDRILAVNLTGAFLCAREAAPYLRASAGRIINIASIRAIMSEPDTPAYAASKGGLVALTHSLAITLGPKVLVNCISPGWIHTGKEKLRPADHRQHPVGRVGRPDDIAALAFFLSSAEADFITGQNFIVDGGITRKMIYV